MYKGIKAKFLQHKDLFQKLIETKNVIIIEKTIEDFYWGCGFDYSGKNRMGKLLMKLRKNLYKKNEK